MNTIKFKKKSPEGDTEHIFVSPICDKGGIIMKHPKLYAKNEKGRYEEYQVPDMDISETLFRGITESMFPYP